MSNRSLRLGVLVGLSLCGSWLAYQVGCGDSETSSPSTPGTDAGAEDAIVDRPVDRPVDQHEEADAIADTKTEDPVIDAGADAAWVSDPDGWTELTDNLDWLPPCRLWRGDLSKLDVPGLLWEPCGTGCERADLPGGLGDLISAASSGTMVEDIPVGHIVGGLPGDPPIGAARLVRLDTGEVLAAHRFQSALDKDGFVRCLMGARDHPLLMSVSGPTNEYALFVADLTEPWTMVPHPVGGIGFLAYLDGLPGLASNSQTSVAVSQTLVPTSFVKVFDGWSGRIDARGEQAVFPDWSGTGQSNGNHGKLQSWTPSTGLQQLLAPDYDPFTVALSDTRLVWVSYPEKLDYYPDATTMKPRFHWSPRATTAAELDPHDGAEIPKSPPRVDAVLQTRGDYAAIVAADHKEDHDLWHTAVTNLTTGELWMLKARDPKHIPITVWAVSDTHVYVAEGISHGWRQVLVRYEIAQLDALEE